MQALTPASWDYDSKIVQCLRSKGYDFCFQCNQYDARICEKYEALTKRYLEDNVDGRANLDRFESGKCYHCKQKFAMI